MHRAAVTIDETRYWLDGAATTDVPADNRGLAFGDGLFRTLLVSRGELVWPGRQMRVLERDARRLGLDTAAPVLQQEIVAAARTAGTPFAALRVTLWRCTTGRGYTPVGRVARRLVSLAPYRPEPHAVWTLGASRHRAWPEPFAGVKHLNRLLSVAAAGEALAQGVPEVLIGGGGVAGPWPWVGGGKSTLYLVAPEQDCLYIPSTRRYGIEGAGLGWLLDWGQRTGLRVQRTARLPPAGPRDEFGLINSLLGPRGIGAIRTGNPRFEWRSAAHATVPGPVTQRMQADFAAEAGTPPLAESNALAFPDHGPVRPG